MPVDKPSKKPIIDMPSKKQLEKAVRPYSEEELTLTPEMEDKMQKLMQFFDQYGIDYGKFIPKFYSYISDKKAYPNFDQYQYIAKQHDMRKWLMAVKDVHYKQRAGLPFKEAIKSAVNGWNKMEVYDFLNWLKFYEEGAQMKYKFAQVWYENGQPGYFLHVKPDPVPEPEPIVDTQSVNDAREEAARQEEKRNVIEKQRQKIIGRLDSAEKLLRSPEGQQFAGQELENLMEAIYSLKKKVQLVNKLSVSTRLYEDMIVRESNVLRRNGFVKAADVLYSLAQTPGQSGESAKGTPGGAVPTDTPPPPDPSGAGQSGTMSGLPATAPGTPNIQTPVDGDQNKDQPAVAALPKEEPQAASIKGLIERMNVGADTTAVDDDLEVDDTEDELMVTEAQVAPPVAPPVPPAALEDVPMTDAPPPERNPPAFAPPAAEKSEAPATEEPLEVTEDDIPDAGEGQASPAASNFDSQIDSAFKNVTVADVVAKLEDISKSYKTREMPRQLGIVDMMLDSLGLASMFPSLSEAQNKALEANNYISTRVDDILAKLRGAMASAEKAPAGTPVERPEVAGIKGKLQSDQDKEAKRKQMRKEQEAAELEGGAGKETPAVEMGELAAPAATPAAAPPPAPRPLG